MLICNLVVYNLLMNHKIRLYITFSIVCVLGRSLAAQDWQVPYNHALASYNTNDYQKSVVYAQDALAKAKTETPLNRAFIIQLITSGYSMLNMPDEGLGFCKEEILLFQKAEGIKSKGLAEAIKKEIVFLQQKGQVKLAIDKCSSAKTQFEESYGKESIPSILFESYTGELALASGDSLGAKAIWNGCLTKLATNAEAADEYSELLLNTASLDESMGALMHAKDKYFSLSKTLEQNQQTQSEVYQDAKAGLARVETKIGGASASSPSGLEQLLKNAITLQQSGQIDKAIEAYQIAEKAATEKNSVDKVSFSIYFNQSRLLVDRGYTREASASLALALPLAASLFQRASAENALVQLTYADIHLALGTVDKAEEKYREAASIVSANIIDRITPFYIKSSNQLMNKEKAETASMLIRPFLCCLSSVSKESLQAIAISYSETQLDLNRPDSVLAFLNHPLFNPASLLVELLRVKAYQEKGDWVKAEDYLKILASRPGITGLESGSIHYQLARMAQALGDYALADQNYHKASALLQQADNEEAWQVRNSLATFYVTLGSYDKSEKEIFSLMQQVPKTHPLHLTLQRNLAANYIETNQLEKAKPMQEKIVVIEKERVGVNHPDYASSLSNLGALYQRMRNYAESEKFFEEALKITKIAYGDRHLTYGVYELNLAISLNDRGEYEKASRLLLHAQGVFAATVGKTHPNYILSEYNLAMAYKRLGKVDLAIPLMMHVGDFYKKQIVELFPAMSENDQVSFFNKINRPIQDYQQFAVEYGRTKPELINQLFDFRLVTKALLLNSSAKIRKQILQGSNQELKNLFVKWLKLKEGIGKLYSGGAITAQVEKQIIQLETEASKAETEIANKSSLFKNSQDQQEVSWRKVQAMLKPGEAAIEFIRLNAMGKKDSLSYAALILKKEMKDPTLVVFSNGRAMESREFSYYRNKVVHRQINDRSFSIFWEPLVPHLKESETIYVSSDGIFNKINLATLFDPVKKEYLTNEHKFILVSNLRDIASVEVEKPSTKSASLFGFAQFGNESTGGKHRNVAAENSILSFLTEDIPSLPGTKVEIETIGSLLKQASWSSAMFEGTVATETNIKALANSGIIHIATHGFFIESMGDEEPVVLSANQEITKNPMFRSGLILSDVSEVKGAQVEHEDGMLTSYEVKNLNFDETDLVVLSACETGSGEIRNGEGVYGLQRAFLLSGVNSVLMSLWKVDDQATQELMVLFYKNLLAGKDKVNSLRNAQLELEKKYPSPYYWGSFILIIKP